MDIFLHFPPAVYARRLGKQAAGSSLCPELGSVEEECVKRVAFFQGCELCAEWEQE